MPELQGGGHGEYTKESNRGLARTGRNAVSRNESSVERRREHQQRRFLLLNSSGVSHFHCAFQLRYEQTPRSKE